jgi:hypothetical protein
MQPVAPEIQEGERYATQVRDLWSGLSSTLARLESIAGNPERLDDDDTVEALRRLQYRLHSASESVFGLSPPADAAPAHSELTAALTSARDATGEVVDAVDTAGSRGVDMLLHEWRGALFRVRLANLRLNAPTNAPAPSANPLPRLHAPIPAAALTIAGTAAFAIGATFELWPVWVAGMLAVCISLLFYRP